MRNAQARPMIRYERRQDARALWAILPCGAITAIAFSAVESMSRVVLVPIAAILLGAAVVFSSLTIRIADGSLFWQFGLGFIRKAVPLTEIVAAELARTRWLDGWGIHYTRRGWLYNVSGFDAVLVTRVNGKRFLLGTDESERLRLAILKGAEAARRGD
jgi:hypothetical protein